MKLRTLIDFILRPIPASETPATVQARRKGDYVVAGVLGVGVLVAVYWGLHLQITAPPGDFSDRMLRPSDEAERPRDAIEVELTFTPGAEEALAERGRVAVPEVATAADLKSELRMEFAAQMQGEARALGEAMKTQLQSDLQSVAPPPVSGWLPPTQAATPPSK